MQHLPYCIGAVTKMHQVECHDPCAHMPQMPVQVQVESLYPADFLLDVVPWECDSVPVSNCTVAWNAHP